MKSIFTLVILLFLYSFSFAQLSKKDQKSLSKIIGEDYIQLPTQKHYPYSDYRDSFKVHMSSSILDDTTGVSFENEYLLWRDLISFCGKEEVIKYINPSYLTVSEYQEFQNYVRDSIARDQIYLNGFINSGSCWSGYNEWSDNDANEWINYQETYYDPKDKEYYEYDPSDRVLGRSLFNLNWNKKLNYSDSEIIPYIADLYIPLSDRIYKIKEFDSRKFMYQYSNFINSYYLDSLSNVYPFQSLKKDSTLYLKGESKEVKEVVATIFDTYSWCKQSLYERDEYSVLSHLYAKLMTDSPAIGINNPQAKAFCDWKQKTLQQKIKDKKLPYTIIISLQTIIDQQNLNKEKPEFTIDSRNYTNQWKITNNDYLSFINAVQDSVLREHLFKVISNNEEANKLLNYNDLYFDDRTFEYTEYNPQDRINGRFLFPLEYTFNLKKLSSKSVQYIDSIKNMKSYIKPIYKFEYIDSKRKSEIGEMIIDTVIWSNDLEEKIINNHLKLKVEKKDSLNPKGKDLDLSYYDIFNHTSSVRSHEQFQRFIIHDSISIVPNKEVNLNQPDSLIKDITYEQAIAYYYWKYPIHNPDPKDDWQKFVLPSKEQFEAIQRGQQIIIPEKKISYPTPLVRYVVHVYRKD